MSSSKERLSESRRIGHQVPEFLQERRGSASFAIDADSPRLSHAERAKTLIYRKEMGVLSTLTHEDGSPFGSIINYAFDSRGELFFIASKLAEHTANLEKDPRASLLVTEEKGEGDQLAVSRVTVLGKLHRVEKTPDLVTSFKKKHRTAAYVMFDDFYAFKFQQVSRVRYIAGFGEMSWVKGSAYDEASPDPVSGDIEKIPKAIEHMNMDHSDANVNIVNRFAKPPLPKPAIKSTLLSVDRFGLDFLAETKEGKRLARVPFAKPLNSSEELKSMLQSMSKDSRL